MAQNHQGQVPPAPPPVGSHFQNGLPARGIPLRGFGPEPNYMPTWTAQSQSAGVFMSNNKLKPPKNSSFVPISYEGFVLRRASTISRSGSKNWSRVTRDEMSFDQPDLEQLCVEHQERNQKSATMEYDGMKIAQKQQVDRIIKAKKDAERDPDAVWSLAMIRKEKKETKPSILRTQIETVAIHVILKRQDRRDRQRDEKGGKVGKEFKDGKAGKESKDGKAGKDGKDGKSTSKPVEPGRVISDLNEPPPGRKDKDGGSNETKGQGKNVDTDDDPIVFFEEGPPGPRPYGPVIHQQQPVLRPMPPQQSGLPGQFGTMDGQQPNTGAFRPQQNIPMVQIIDQGPPMAQQQRPPQQQQHPQQQQQQRPAMAQQMPIRPAPINTTSTNPFDRGFQARNIARDDIFPPRPSARSPGPAPQDNHRPAMHQRHSSGGIHNNTNNNTRRDSAFADRRAASPMHPNEKVRLWDTRSPSPSSSNGSDVHSYMSDSDGFTGPSTNTSYSPESPRSSKTYFSHGRGRDHRAHGGYRNASKPRRVAARGPDHYTTGYHDKHGVRIEPGRGPNRPGATGERRHSGRYEGERKYDGDNNYNNRKHDFGEKKQRRPSMSHASSHGGASAGTRSSGGLNNNVEELLEVFKKGVADERKRERARDAF